MDNANELKEALDFLSPSALTYNEWVAVGMALKDGGLPVTVWEQWSTRDAGRYHKGECVKKWESFHGGEGSRPAMHGTGTTTLPLAPAHSRRAAWWTRAGWKPMTWLCLSSGTQLTS